MALFRRKTKPSDGDTLQAIERGVAQAVGQVLAAIPSPGALSNNQPPYPLYHYDNPSWFATAQSPKRRPGSIVDTTTLRQIADTYDVARSCINHLKREVAAVPIKIVTKDADDDGPSTAGRIKDASAYFKNNGGLGGPGVRRSHFEGQIIEDVLVIGAAAIYHTPTRGGFICESIPIAADTIRPNVDGFGWANPDSAYEQWIMGMKVASFGVHELTYDGIWPVSYSPFFRSPFEWLLSPIMSALKADEWNRTWLTDGNTPSDIIALPADWDPDQIASFAAWFDSLLAGNNAERQKMRFVPSGSQRVGTSSRKDQDFQEFELWLLRRTCSVLGVQPASIGYTGEQYKVSQDESMSATTQFGAGMLLEFRKEIYDDILERCGYDDLEVVNVTSKEEDANKRTERLKAACGKPWISVNEARKEEGRDPVEGFDLISGNEPEPPEVDPKDQPDDADAEADLERWQRKALRRIRSGKSADCDFESPHIPSFAKKIIRSALANATSAEHVRALFTSIGA